jgi:hypothetical protein
MMPRSMARRFVWQKIFVSCWRREVGFVDDLVRDLERTGHDVWLNDRDLIPGKPWQDQICNRIQDADVVLLVVSKTFLSSQNVEVEWKRVIEQNKRIILLVCEAVTLPETGFKVPMLVWGAGILSAIGAVFGSGNARLVPMGARIHNSPPDAQRLEIPAIQKRFRQVSTIDETSTILGMLIRAAARCPGC